MKYYIKVRVLYVDYATMSRNIVKIRREYNEPQEDAESALMMCVHDFYSQHDSCDIISVEVLENALF